MKALAIASAQAIIEFVDEQYPQYQDEDERKADREARKQAKELLKIKHPTDKHVKKALAIQKNIGMLSVRAKIVALKLV